MCEFNDSSPTFKSDGNLLLISHSSFLRVMVFGFGKVEFLNEKFIFHKITIID